jgi:hypothetical protein
MTQLENIGGKRNCLLFEGKGGERKSVNGIGRKQ